LPQVKYALPDGTAMEFDIAPLDDWQPVGLTDVAGQITAAVAPLIDGARVILDKLKEVRPDEVKLKFGIKVSGTANWVVAKAATEGNFEVTLTWASNEERSDACEA
jgi:Trypsin-co-occurring domain 1